MNRSWVPGFEPKYQPMNEMQSKMFLVATMLEAQKKEAGPELEATFLIQVLNKRIEVYKLPISFSGPGKMATLGLVDRPGSMTALLIDCLNAYEGKTITPELLANLYPTGFYDEDSLMKYVDDFIKPRKVKWSEIY